MYRISLPMISRTFARDDREQVVKTLKEMGVFRVFLAIGAYHFDAPTFADELRILRDNAAFLHDRGFEVGAWMWSFMDCREDSPYTRVRLLSGAESKQSVCCADEDFCAFAADYLQQVARCGVDMVLYDDDYRYGYLDGDAGCLCDHHLAMMREILGERVIFDQVVPYLMSGGENRYRTAWQKAKRASLLGFAKRMREALDEVAPSTRLGLCSCFTVWDLDGVSSAEISRALAGNTRPFLRLIGAPYWAVKRSMGGHRLQDVIEVERMEISFCGEHDDMEVVCEGDTYPRPRWICPAAFLEGFDTAMRADGRLDGILKYAIDYTSTLPYEMGYIKRHLKNAPLYASIEELFGGKRAVGVRVWESLKRYETTVIPPAVVSGRELCYMSFSYAARMLAAASIPTTYDATDAVGIAFGENARALPLEALKNGMILDLRAAEILQERGVDVGLVKKGEYLSAENEIIENDQQVVPLNGAKVYRTTLREGAQVQSWFSLINVRNSLSLLWESRGTDFENVTAASYRYENEKGERFFVLCFDGQLASDHLLRSYARQALLCEALPYLARKPFVATVTGHPDLYVMAKERDGVLTVGLWNLCIDDVDEPVVHLGEAFSEIRAVGCDAHLDGNTVTLSRIEPYGFAAVEVKK